MTREEEINNAKEAFYRKILQEGTYYDPRDCFEEGAEWADNHPKSPWISVEDDLPCNHEELVSKGSSSTKRVIVIEDGGYYFDLMTLSNNGKWKWLYSFHPTHWMPIPELPKE